MEKKIYSSAEASCNGDYSTFVYIVMPPSLKFTKIINELKEMLEKEQIKFNTTKEFHLSLLRENIVLKYLEIDLFLEKVKAKVSSFRCFTVGITDRLLKLKGKENKWFISLSVMSGKKLRKLLSEINKIVKIIIPNKKFNEHSILDEFLPHVSLLSFESEKEECFVSKEQVVSENISIIKIIKIEKINILIGKNNYIFHLKA